MNLTHLKSLLNNDDQLVARFVAVFVAETPRQLAALGKALQQENLTDTALIAHAIKSQLRYMGLAKLAAIAAQLEKGAENSIDINRLKANFLKLRQGVLRVINDL